jgi:hypothetical protein
MVTVVSQTPSAGGRLVDEARSPVNCTETRLRAAWLGRDGIDTDPVCRRLAVVALPVPAAVVGWRVAPDRRPLVTLRLAPDDDAQTADAGANDHRLAADRGRAAAQLRGPEAIEKERHDRRS